MLKLVYGCLTFSLVACAFLFVSAAREGESFHGMTNSMVAAVDSGGTVLAADRYGAITQSGNGKVVGFRRNGAAVWSTKFDRFKESPSNPFGAGTNDATGWCMDACPAALIAFEDDYDAFGGASEYLATELNYGPPKPEDVLALAAKDTAFLRAIGEGNAAPRLYVLAPGKPFKPLGSLPPSEVQPAQPNTRAIMGSAKGDVGVLSRLVLRDGTWQITNRSTTEIGLKNICISDDENWIGSVGTRVSRSAFSKASGAALGPVVTSGTCTVDDQGITAIYTPRANPKSIVAARYSANGRALWQRKFGAQRLLSPAGSPFLVTQSADGDVTAIDAVSGREVHRSKLVGAPFVGGDGSIVAANRQGEPRWVLVGKAAASQ